MRTSVLFWILALACLLSFSISCGCGDNDDDSGGATDDDAGGEEYGACCVDGTCSVTTYDDCLASWQGPETNCDPNPCGDDDLDDDTDDDVDDDTEPTTTTTPPPTTSTTVASTTTTTQEPTTTTTQEPTTTTTVAPTTTTIEPTTTSVASTTTITQEPTTTTTLPTTTTTTVSPTTTTTQEPTTTTIEPTTTTTVVPTTTTAPPTTTTTVVTTTSTTTTTWESGDEEVFVPEGAFQMGCEPDDTQCQSDESPRHEVWLSAYYIDTYEVTNESCAEFLTWHGNDCDGYECVDAASSELRLSESGGVWSADVGYEDHPMVEVSWYGATAYCEAQGKRLPTEAEWEKAAKGATEHYIYPWGETFIASAANVQFSGDPFDDGTTPVGYYNGSDHGGVYQTTDGSSPYGAHDMVGNVWEWVSDWYVSDYYDEYSTDAWPADPQGPDSGTFRVLRGGDWGRGDTDSRASNRNWNYPDNSLNAYGFRCSRDDTSPPTTTTTQEPTTTTTIFTTTSTTSTTWVSDDEEVLVPEGTFQMGCEPEDTECETDESPRHEVWLSTYIIDKYEVANTTYAEFLTWHGNECEGYECVEAGSLLSESGGVWSADAGYEFHPLVDVTWYGAKAYCEAQGKRLPTEAEWEKAAKGATEHYIYPWGDAWIANAANYRYSGDPFGDGTTPVGYYDGSNHGGAYQTTDGRSPYGAHDMAGNVYEWVNDWHALDYYDDYSPDAWPNDPQGPDTGTHHVLRGGSWNNNYGSTYNLLRASARSTAFPGDAITTVGFRCSRD
jgi:formylglycine-generating enzyme required for sulfatase activity